MSKIVYYPCTKDAFDKVAEAGGISYYLLDKQNHDDKYIKISCSMQPLFNSNGFELHKQEYILDNEICRNLINKCNIQNYCITRQLNFKVGKYVIYKDNGYETKKFENDVELFGGKAGGEKDINGNKFFRIGYKPRCELFTLDGVDKYKVCISVMPGGTSFFGLFNMDGTAIGLTPTSVIGPNQVNKGSYYCLRTFDTLDEAKSLQSYLNCRLIRFLVRCSVVGTTLTEEFFRFVPDPQDWSVIYEDKPLQNYIPDENGNYIDNNGNKHCSLYVKYKLTKDDINIIESVIKERK